MRKYSWLLVGVLLMAMGCKPATMNKKMAYTDSACTLATAISLDEVPVDKFDLAKTKTIEVAEALKAVLGTGSLASLPVRDVRFALNDVLIQKNWQDYIFIVDAILQYVQAQNVDVNIIGVEGVKLIGIGLDAVIESATRCQKEFTVEKRRR